MSSEYDEPDDYLSGLEPVLNAFAKIRQDNADLILLLEAQRDRRQKRPPPAPHSQIKSRSDA